MKVSGRISLVAAAMLAAAPGSAKDRNEAAATPPPPLAKLLECRAQADAAQRLACFDSAVASLDQAVAGGEVAVVDREQIRKTKRSLFGFTLGDLPLFGHGDGDKGEQDEVKEITATLRSAGSNANGYVFTLEDGARWEQSDAVQLGRTPHAGDQVTIRRMALGSYKLRFKIGPSIKVRRIG